MVNVLQLVNALLDSVRALQFIAFHRFIIIKDVLLDTIGVEPSSNLAIINIVDGNQYWPSTIKMDDAKLCQQEAHEAVFMQNLRRYAIF
ncbi:MAG: hypothetical protein K2M96_00190 [Prevotella sp.]|nr:hypothetical protein [Prevotella sp.]